MINQSLTSAAGITGGNNQVGTPDKRPELVYTVFISDTDIGKRLELDPDGKIVKIPLGNLGDCSYLRMACSDLEEFASQLQELTTKNALAYGVFEGSDNGRVVTKNQKPNEPGAVARCRDDMGWSNGPGIMFLDYDPPSPEEAIDRDALVQQLRAACPFLANLKLIWRPSASSSIRNTATGELMRDIVGQRLYLAVDQAGQIPMIGKNIADRLWLAGHGRYDVSKAGSLLERTLFDTSVWQPERLDFAGGAVCVPPLVQGSLMPVIIPGSRESLNPDDVKPLSAAENRQLGHLKGEARQIAAPGAWEVKERYIERRAREVVGDSPTEENLRQAASTIRAACEQQQLLGEFVLEAEDGRKVTVAELLDSPEQWDGVCFADPLEPDYQQDNRIAIAKLINVDRPYIYSHAHGGRTFQLIRALTVITLSHGDTHLAVDRVLEVIRDRGDLYEVGGVPVRVVGRELVPVIPVWLTDYVSRLIRFQRHDARSNHLVPVDPPNRIADVIISKRGERGFPALKAIVTAPTMTPDGQVITTPGYDAESGLLLIANGTWPVIPDSPSDSEVKAAYELLWKPFQDFPFIDVVDRSVVFAALLTAAVRPCLPTAPVFGFDAPTAGSGKTLLARCIGILAIGAEPAISPPFDDEAEARKRIYSQLLSGCGAIIIDNVTSALDSAVLASVLTGPELEDRILGASQMVKVANRAMWFFTGNNLRPAGDTVRRMLVARIDPKMEATQVYRREFTLDPADYCLRHRLEMIAAGLTILRAYIAAGHPKSGKGRTASYEQWSDLVRDAVIWCGKRSIADVIDPTAVLDRQAEFDPEQGKLAMLMDAWFKVFGDKPTRLAQLIEAAKLCGPSGSALAEALHEIDGKSDQRFDNRMIGGWIQKRVGKVVLGRYFERSKLSTNGVANWMVKSIGQLDEIGQKQVEPENCQTVFAGDPKTTNSNQLTNSPTGWQKFVASQQSKQAERNMNS
jgi:hypothetical protein